MSTFLSLLTAQTLTTAFLAVVLWSLYARFRQGFNRWWAWAWTSSAVFLAAGRMGFCFESAAECFVRGGCGSVVFAARAGEAVLDGV